MFVKPPVVRTNRNLRGRPPSTPTSLVITGRPLLRQVVRSRRSDPVREAYVFEVREGPVVNSSTNAGAAVMIPQPWVIVHDYFKGSSFVSLPVSICSTLLKHLLTCSMTDDDEHQIESSEDSEVECSSSPSPKDKEEASSTETLGEAVSQVEGETVTKKASSRVGSRTFQLSLLKPIRIVCEATGCTLEVTARNPVAKHTSVNSAEPTQTVQADLDKRWLVSAPLEVRTNVSSSVEQAVDNSGIGSTTNGSGRRQNFWERRGTLELHERLMPQLLTFLADVVTRYRTVDLIPKVPSLYSMSGERRFLFNLKDTRWGKRLHISQVTDLHRNIIGIPLEDLVSFRSRLDTVIQSLGLDNHYAIRSSIYRSGENRSTHKEQHTSVPSHNTSNATSEYVDGMKRDEHNNRIHTNNTRNRTIHGRERRSLRTGVFALNNMEGGYVGVNGVRGHQFKQTEKNQMSSNRDLRHLMKLKIIK
ncbi:unnamed protein product [Schistosoma turkestanicum]|nr:unnamed protein product [Schistosoma turkestanicum]